jgi:hypothetical protein
VRVAILDMKMHGELTGEAWRRFWNVVTFNLDQHRGFGGYQMITSELTIYPYLGNSFLAVSAPLVVFALHSQGWWAWELTTCHDVQWIDVNIYKYFVPTRLCGLVTSLPLPWVMQVMGDATP